MKQSNQNISRIEIQRDGVAPTMGWEVRINRRGKKLSKFFSDSLLGGKRKALQEARVYRDKMEDKYPPYTRVELMAQPTARNSSGIPGVRRRENVVTKNGWAYTYATWEASWTPEKGGRRTKRQFSVLKYGEDKAYEMAVRARSKALREIRKEEQEVSS
jgi:hypothetical protein